MISTPIPAQKQVNAIVHQFILNGPDEVKRRVLSANYGNGGLKMVSIVTKIKTQQIMWLKRFNDGNETVWKLILDQYLNRVGGLAFLLKCNFDIKKLKCHIPLFYKNILNARVNMNASIPNIFIGKCRGSPLSIDAFNTLLKSAERLEEMIARDKDKLDLHIAKWSTVNMMFHLTHFWPFRLCLTICTFSTLCAYNVYLYSILSL